MPDLILEHAATVQRAATLFGQLSTEQINWKPAPDKWGVGLCLEHLIVTDNTYRPLFASILAGTYSPALWTRISPFSAWFGRWLVREMGATVNKPIESPAAFRPQPTKVMPSTQVAEYVKHGMEMNHLLAQLAATDTKVCIPSPAMALITYPLADCIELMVKHHARHMAQAERAMLLPGFPKA